MVRQLRLAHFLFTKKFENEGDNLMIKTNFKVIIIVFFLCVMLLGSIFILSNFDANVSTSTTKPHIHRFVNYICEECGTKDMATIQVFKDALDYEIQLYNLKIAISESSLFVLEENKAKYEKLLDDVLEELSNLPKDCPQYYMDDFFNKHSEQYDNMDDLQDAAKIEYNKYYLTREQQLTYDIEKYMIDIKDFDSKINIEKTEIDNMRDELYEKVKEFEEKFGIEYNME